jgi:hypothetical protein
MTAMLLDRINVLAAPALRRESGWVADYVRLRFAAVRKADGNGGLPEQALRHPGAMDQAPFLGPP